LRRLFGREPAPGRYETGTQRAFRGWISSAPLLWPSRDFLLYIPRGHSSWRRAPLVVLCHGCRQTPEDIAQGTRIAALADARGFLVLLPRQKDEANRLRCWTWFDTRTSKGAGEAAIIAAQIRSVLRGFRVDRRRVIAAGMSAGGAMAAALGVRYPGMVTAVAVHSGLPCGAAASPMTAIRVMSAGPDRDVVAIAEEARRNAPPGSLPVPLLAIHGGSDAVVSPRHATALVRQYLRLNGHPGVAAGDPGAALPAADAESRSTLPDGREAHAREWRLEGRLIARFVEVPDLDHAWAGGDASLPYNDARPPDATALLGAFIDEALP
jgi:poly(3-hydroxybutyrate) depolymerase